MKIGAVINTNSSINAGATEALQATPIKHDILPHDSRLTPGSMAGRVSACGRPLHDDMKAPQSTADSPNRLRDRARVERDFNLPEFGDPNRKFFSPSGELIARGFNRMVYGDHGPYIEFTKNQIDLTRLNKDEQRVEKLPKRRFDLWYSSDGYVKAYDQIRDVSDRPNPPRGKYACSNDRADGYADYRPGFVYVDPECFVEDGGDGDSVSSVSTRESEGSGFAGSVRTVESSSSLSDIIAGLQPSGFDFLR